MKLISTGKSAVRWVLGKAGYDLVNVKTSALHDVVIGERIGDPYADMKRFAGAAQRLIVCDIGANAGQSVSKFKNHFPHSELHAFEPAVKTFKKLAANFGGRDDVILNNVGVGARDALLDFHENISSDMSSFLEPDEFAWGDVVSREPVPVVSLDSYCANKCVPHISILKIDTQGFDFEVLRGAKSIIGQGRVQLIYLEIIFSAMYKGMARYHRLFEFMEENGFQLVSFYNFHYQNGVLSWADGLFVHRGHTQS